ncbi:hypothetical protein ABPG74_007949 [Tetrahymena malaccensis]
MYLLFYLLIFCFIYLITLQIFPIQIIIKIGDNKLLTFIPSYLLYNYFIFLFYLSQCLPLLAQKMLNPLVPSLFLIKLLTSSTRLLIAINQLIFFHLLLIHSFINSFFNKQLLIYWFHQHLIFACFSLFYYFQMHYEMSFVSFYLFQTNKPKIYFQILIKQINFLKQIKIDVFNISLFFQKKFFNISLSTTDNLYNSQHFYHNRSYSISHLKKHQFNQKEFLLLLNYSSILVKFICPKTFSLSFL